MVFEKAFRKRRCLALLPGYMTFDFFQLDISDYSPGTILFMR